jgi:hypothetical protein
MTNQTLKNHCNKELTQITKGYLAEIPLAEIFTACHKHLGQVLDIDGTPWSGFLCGETGQANFRLQNVRMSLVISWYTMPSGKYEVVAYVS